MAGAEVPAAGDLGEDTNTNATEEQLLEDLAEAVRRMLGIGSATLPVYTISAGVIDPTTGMIAVDTEGSTSTDDLTTIQGTHYLTNSFILVRSRSAPARSVTLKHGTGNIFMADAQDFVLDEAAKFIVFKWNASYWSEMWRWYGGLTSEWQDFFGLGSVAVLNNGAVDAATLQTHAASYFLAASATAANSLLLGGAAATAFVRADLSSTQIMAGGLQANTGVVRSNHPSGAGAPTYDFVVNGLLRGKCVFDGINSIMYMQLLDTDGSTLLGGFRIKNPAISAPEFWNGTSWVSLVLDTTPSHGRVMWDLLGGAVSYPEGYIRIVHSELIVPLPNTGATVHWRIKAKANISTAGSTPVNYYLSVRVGPAGDETDPQVARSADTYGNDNLDIIIDEPNGYSAYSPGDYMTLVFGSYTLTTNSVHSSTDSGYNTDRVTYLDAEQIG